MEALYANGTSWKQCSLPDLPETRYQHSQNGLMVCGGWGPGIRTCQGLGYHLASRKNLLQNRTMHSTWVSGPFTALSVVIMGGGGNAKTTEKISTWSDGDASMHFPLKYNIE